MDKPRKRKATSATATGSSKKPVKAPREPNISFGKVGISGAQKSFKGGSDKEQFGKGRTRKRLFAYEAQGGPLSAMNQRKRVPKDSKTQHIQMKTKKK